MGNLGIRKCISHLSPQAREGPAIAAPAPATPSHATLPVPPSPPYRNFQLPISPTTDIRTRVLGRLPTPTPHFEKESAGGRRKALAPRAPVPSVALGGLPTAGATQDGTQRGSGRAAGPSGPPAAASPGRSYPQRASAWGPPSRSLTAFFATRVPQTRSEFPHCDPLPPPGCSGRSQGSGSRVQVRPRRRQAAQLCASLVPPLRANLAAAGWGTNSPTPYFCFLVGIQRAMAATSPGDGGGGGGGYSSSSAGRRRAFLRAPGSSAMFGKLRPDSAPAVSPQRRPGSRPHRATRGHLQGWRPRRRARLSQRRPGPSRRPRPPPAGAASEPGAAGAASPALAREAD